MYIDMEVTFRILKSGDDFTSKAEFANSSHQHGQQLVVLIPLTYVIQPNYCPKLKLSLSVQHSLASPVN